MLLLLLCATAHGSWLSQAVDTSKKLIEKPGEWVAKQSGIKPTVDRTNETLESTNAAVKKLGELGAPATVAIQSITRTSDAAGELLITIKWPIVISAYLGALWLGSLAFNGWRAPSRLRVPGTVNGAGASPAARQDADDDTLTRSGRFLLIAFGSLLFFFAMFAIQLFLNPRLNLDAHLVPYLAVAAFRSAIAAALLCWFRIPKAWIAVGLGIMASVLMFAVIALTWPETDQKQVPQTGQGS